MKVEISRNCSSILIHVLEILNEAFDYHPTLKYVNIKKKKTLSAPPPPKKHKKL